VEKRKLDSEWSVELGKMPEDSEQWYMMIPAERWMELELAPARWVMHQSLTEMEQQEQEQLAPAMILAQWWVMHQNFAEMELAPARWVTHQSLTEREQQEQLAPTMIPAEWWVMHQSFAEMELAPAMIPAEWWVMHQSFAEMVVHLSKKRPEELPRATHDGDVLHVL
jgi:hypothetical protein